MGEPEITGSPIAFSDSQTQRIALFLAPRERKKNGPAPQWRQPMPGRPERLDLDFLAHPRLNNRCDWVAVGAYFGDEFLPFGIGF
jgi:hypothetical protein